MSSLREFATKTLTPLLIDDARKHLIFNEADLQHRASYHLYNRFVRQYKDLYLLNQPTLRLGIGRGVVTAKPDIVIADRDGPITAMELKCFLYNARASAIADLVWADIDQLHRFKQKYPDSEYTFALVLVDITDVDEFKWLCGELCRERQPWMKHYLRRHVINLYCDENFRQRRGYGAWADKWIALSGRG